MTQKILVFAGKKQSGKSSAANFVTGYILAQMGRRGNTNCPNNFTIDEDGSLIVDTVVSDIDGNRVVEGGTLDLSRMDEDFIVWAYNILWPTVKIYAFADELKRIATTVFNIDPALVYGSDEDKNTPIHIKWKNMCLFLPPRKINDLKKSEKYDKKMTVREFLQFFGTNICRVLDDDCWTRTCFNQIVADGSELAIIQDCRFANEVKAAKKIGAKVIKLTRTVQFDVHESENDLDKLGNDQFDLVIDNEYLTIREKNMAILDYLYQIGWLTGHVGLENV